MKVQIIHIAISLFLLLPAITNVQVELRAQSRETNPQKSKIICPQCGKENSIDAKFCWNDGYPLSKPVKEKILEAVPFEPPAKINLLTDKKPVDGSSQLLENMSDVELRLLFNKLSTRFDISPVFEKRGPGFVNNLSEEEFVSLLRNTIRDERIIRTKVVQKSESGFGTFLKSIGAVTLIIMGLGIVTAS